jgi:hypothetical protein
MRFTLFATQPISQAQFHYSGHGERSGKIDYRFGDLPFKTAHEANK